MEHVKKNGMMEYWNIGIMEKERTWNSGILE